MEIKNNKEDVDEVNARLELEDEYCQLKHNALYDFASNHPAVEYLVQYLGTTKEDGIQEAIHELRIPICQECMDGLSDPNWLLLYCVQCNSSQWFCRSLYHRDLPEGQVRWVDECPHCKGEK